MRGLLRLFLKKVEYILLSTTILSILNLLQ
nr:MAG TPA: hypothetical protein [Caudoviricetes sp.]